MTVGYAMRVYLEDTDAGGIMYHASHLKFMERARTDWLRQAGLNRANLGAQVVVHQLQIDYQRPARLDDLLMVTVHLLAHKAASFTLLQQLWRDNELISSAHVSLAVLDDQFRPTRMPESLRQVLTSAN